MPRREVRTRAWDSGHHKPPHEEPRGTERVAPARTNIRELARRTNDGIEVPFDAFSHPYAYAAVQSVRSAIGPECAVAR